ncbi:MAG: VCBS repeat-containing protein [Hymenobacter sp.]|nr:MAG: VCBS repeat-containing protein [Hymenobacter sp.]
MKHQTLLLLCGLLFTSFAYAQTPTGRFGFEVGSVAKLVQGTDTLAHAWAGGFNTPQFSSIDLNGDGQLDLYVFDRETGRSYTFLSTAAGTGRRWRYAPGYESCFPADLANWVQLRDYDGDGQADLFTANTRAGIRVFHNEGLVRGMPRFRLVSEELIFALTPKLSVNINTGSYNVPAIQDINGDGRLDILTYDFVNSTSLELYLNTGTGSGTNLASFQQSSNYWGHIQSCFDCAAYQSEGATACSTNPVQPVIPGSGGGGNKRLHSTALRVVSKLWRYVDAGNQVLHSMGHNVLAVDLNGDGKLDLLDGRDNCPQLTRLLNTGSSSTSASFTQQNISSSFPLATPLSNSIFPAPYLLDTDFDGVQDLLVSPNMVDNSIDHVSMRRTVQQFTSSSSPGALPAYRLVTDGFLQNDMLDVSEGAAPTFGDLDGDGLADMLVGTVGDKVNGYYRASIYQYRNVGTASRPVFRLVTDDYLGLAAAAARTPGSRFEAIRPVLVDLNRDGALDLVYSGFVGTVNRLHFMLNTARAKQPARFKPASTDYFRSPGAAGGGALATTLGDTPCFFDVDNDGYVDLLLGTNDQTVSGYSLRYYHNQGAKGAVTNRLFVLADADYGKLRDGNLRPINLSPTVADFDGDGAADLLTMDGSVVTRFYSDFRKQGPQFTERTDVFFNRLAGTYTATSLGSGTRTLWHYAPVAADLNQDGRPELYVGTETGGIVSYLPGSWAISK